ncbi:SIP domain-containing protein [Crossiella sp. SN42]|uniref:SIP domain-containing protein n=1 Tax=Crossiella sp. SN42 TaxID=2944808 RepID=UPI0027E0917C|nr:SIP domain-containing protein [Crossiella sp. SN42]
MTPPLVDHLRVTAVRRLSPHVVRVSFTGPGLENLSTWPDQQLKLCFPQPGQTEPVLPALPPDGDPMRWYQAYLAIPEAERPVLRSYTVRAHHPATATIDVDFVLHGGADGPATAWAARAEVGDVLGRYGPDAQYARPLGESDWVLFAGDLTALPAIATLLESLAPGRKALVYLEVPDAADEQPLSTAAELELHWVRQGPDALLNAVRGAELPSGTGLAWLAGEAGAVRSLRRHLLGERGMAKRDIEFTGYWRLRLTQDDAPTEEDMAEVQERLAEANQPTGLDTFEQAYREHSAPWVIGEPQPAVVELAAHGEFRGEVLDVGCGDGQHTIHLTALGHSVLGVDYSALAITAARANAVRAQSPARFEVANALDLGPEPRYDTVLDSALFHVFGAADRAAYVRSLHRVCRPGAVLHLLALSDKGPGFGPEVSDSVIRDAFAEGWVIESLADAEYRGVVGQTEDGGKQLGDLPAWLAKIRRV